MNFAAARPHKVGFISGKSWQISATGCRIHGYDVLCFCISVLCDEVRALHSHVYTGFAPCEAGTFEFLERRCALLNVLNLQEFHERIVLPNEQRLQAPKRGLQPIEVVVIIEINHFRVGRQLPPLANSPRRNDLRVIATATS